MEFTGFVLGEYGEPGLLRDRLVAAILAGEKRATASLRAQYGGEALPVAGDGEILVDSAGKPVAVLRTTRVEIVALGEVTDGCALAEGEGFADVAQWRAAHLEFWASLGFHPEPEDEVVCQYFELVARL